MPTGHITLAVRPEDKLAEARHTLNSDAVDAYSLDNRKEEDLKSFFEHVGPFNHLFTPGASYVRAPSHPVQKPPDDGYLLR